MRRNATVTAALVMIAGPALAAGPYGAIAYSPESDNSAAVADQPTQEDAESAALKSCRDETKANPDSCQSALWFKNACGALAKDATSSAWGTGWGDTQKIATDWAIKVCQQYGGTDCKLTVAVCSPGGAATIPSN